MTSPTADNTISIADAPMSRRGIFRAGGLTIALGALIAACADEIEDANPARVGDVPAPPALPEGVRTDGVLFRTAVSIHYSIINAHGIAKEVGNLSAAQSAIVDAFIAANTEAITELNALAQAAGSEPWTCANPRFDRVILTPIRDRIVGRPRQGNEEADVPPSDDPTRDALAFAHAMETLSAATHQAFVPQFSLPEYRSATMLHGEIAARRAAALALAINPENRINPASVASANIEPASDATTTTTTIQNIAQGEPTDEGATDTTVAPAVAAVDHYAIPSQFGTLSAVQLSIGAPSAAGTQFTINIDTPSLNSFIYDYQQEC